MTETERPKIGDFQRQPDAPSTPAAKKEAPRAEGPTAANLEAAEDRLSKEAGAAELDLKPLESYEEALKTVGLTREEAAEIFDEYLEKGFYERPFEISKRVSGVFRTRSRQDTQRFFDYIEATKPTYQGTIDEVRARYLLAASLKRIGKREFEFAGPKMTREEIEKLFETRLAYVDNSGDSLFRLLCEQLSKFDSLISVALKEGAVENF